MSSGTPVDASLPRPSPRVAMDATASDGDVWKERIAVCESATADGKPKLLVRSYYRNSRTAERVWDEPPSGAGKVQHATAEMREKADLQLQDLQVTLEMIPDEAGVEDDKKKKKKKKRGNFLNVFRKKEKKNVDDSKDLNLQKAIARSMVDQHGSGGGEEPVVYFDPESSSQAGEDDQMAMAKALSMSESAGPDKASVQDMSEDEMLHRALEASRLDAHRNGVADVAMPAQPGFVSDDDLDRKMPYRS